MDIDTTAGSAGISDTESTQAAAETTSQGMEGSNTPADTATGSLPTPTPSTDPSASANGAVPPPVPEDPKGNGQPATNWDDPSNPYLKRHNDALAHATRLFQKTQELEKTWFGLDPAKTRELMAEQQRREQSMSLRPHNKGHQEHGKFQALQAKADTYRQMLTKASTPEQQEAIKALGASMFSQDEIGMMEAADSDRKQLISDFQADPRGFLSQHLIPTVQQEIQRAFAFMDQHRQAQQWMQDPKHTSLMQTNADDLAWMLDENIPGRDKAIAFAAQKAELEALKRQVGQQTQQQQVAEVRTQSGFARGQRQAPNSAAPQRPKDPVKYLVDKGYTPSTTEFSAALQKINNGTFKY